MDIIGIGTHFLSILLRLLTFPFVILKDKKQYFVSLPTYDV